MVLAIKVFEGAVGGLLQYYTYGVLFLVFNSGHQKLICNNKIGMKKEGLLCQYY